MFRALKQQSLPVQWHPGRQLARTQGCDVSGERKLIRKETGTHVWAQFEVADTTVNILVVRVIQMAVEDLLG